MPIKSPVKSEILAYPAESDPLTLTPPADETAAQREARVQADRNAKKISDAIDEDIDRQHIAERRAPKAVKVLLLGAYYVLQSSLLINFRTSDQVRASLVC